MDFQELAYQVGDLISDTKSVYLRTNPEYPDFTSKSEFEILVWNTRGRISIQASPSNIVKIIALFDATIFDKDQVAHLYTWNFKSLASYFLKFCESSRFVTPTNSIIDLKPIEAFLGIRKNPPENLIEAINRTKLVAQDKSWQRVYKSVHLPLSLRVLPTIETNGLLNESVKRVQYPCYEIEGQVNGRMNCHNKFAYCYLPHTLGEETKRVLKPQGHGWRYLYADFKYCEVVILWWLTGDETLKQILDSGDDLHSRIYEIVTEDKCDTDNKRNLSKRMFLPVMYGCGPKSLGANLGVSESIGGELFKRIKLKFSTALNWLHEREQEAKNGVVRDHFGRPRQFAEGESYKARNFHIQSVAAVFCQEKLIELWKVINGNDLRLLFSIHDGYGLICQLDVAKESYRTVKDTLETESKLCPNLKLSVEIKFGARLENMKVLWKD